MCLYSGIEIKKDTNLDYLKTQMGKEVSLSIVYVNAMTANLYLLYYVYSGKKVGRAALSSRW